MIDLDEADKLGKAATEFSRLKFSKYHHGGCRVVADFRSTPSTPFGLDLVADFYDANNTAFFVFARNNWQSLVDELRELRATAAHESAMTDCFSDRLEEAIRERDEARAAAKFIFGAWQITTNKPERGKELTDRWPWLNS